MLLGSLVTACTPHACTCMHIHVHVHTGSLLMISAHDFIEALDSCLKCISGFMKARHRL